MEEDPFSGLGLKEVTLSNQSLFRTYFNSLQDPLSDYTFAQFFSWGNSLRILWKEIRGHLCIFANGTGDLTLLMPPIGQTGSDRALDEAFEIMDAYNVAHNVPGRSRVEYVSDELLTRFNRSRLSVRPMGTDYLYNVQRMIDLAGGDLASKRQLKNRFLRNHACQVEAFDPGTHLEPCLRLLALWKQQQDGDAPQQSTESIKRQKETLACELALRYATDLGLKGLVVYARNADQPDAPMSLRGFTFGEELGSDQSSIIIEKTDLGAKGLAQFIFSEFCARYWSHRPLVNAGDDWGLPSLAWTKMSYRPVKLLQKYEMRISQGAAVSMAVPATPALAAPQPAVVRPARKADVAAAVELEQTCFSVDCLTKRQLNYLQQRPSAVFLVAEDGGRLVGDCISLVRKHKRGLSGRIYSLAVRNEFRGRKIGQRLLTDTIAGLVSRGVRRVYLEVDQTNTRALQLYERTGFKRVGHLPDYYGQGKHAIHMMYEAPAMPSQPAASPQAGG